MNNIYNEIANNYQVSPEEVEKEILIALSQARESTSPTAKAFWQDIDENASVEEIVEKIISRIALVV